MPDIDIDFADRDVILSKIHHRVAKLDSGKKHNTGVYVTEIPHNPVDSLSTIDHKTADERGYCKLDFLNVSIYKDIRDEEHLVELMNREPLWDLLEHKDFSGNVFHVSGHEDVLNTLKPRSVEDLAAVLAIIRPAKRHLVKESWDVIRKEVWIKPEDGAYYFKKAHAVSYAMAVVVHMNLLCEKIAKQSAGS